MEERIAKMEGILEQMDKRLNHLESNFRWILGILITMWITIIWMWLTTIWIILAKIK